MSKTRVGLLGAGYIVKSHARALRGTPGVEIASVCDQSLGRARAIADEFAIPAVHGSVEELAASDVDAVHVLLPPSAHLSAARTLIEAGKTVFLEKPMGPDAAGCRELADLADARGVKLGVNHNFLFTPGYEPIRDAVRDGALGPVDQLTVNWLVALPLLQFGPFNTWMVSRPGNLVLELGSHLAAFALDLLGPVEVVAAHASNPLDLPGDQRVWRRWNAVAQGQRGSMVFNLSTAPGQSERSVHLRALGGAAHLDFAKGLGWQEATSSNNPIFEDFAAARASAAQLGVGSVKGFGRYLTRTLRKAPAENPFEDSILRSVRRFYESVAEGQVDERLTGRFGADVIGLCESIVERSGVARDNAPAPSSVAASTPSPAPRKSTVLVVGGTGFIGRRLVRRLAERGVGVRVLTRGLGSARIDLAGLDVELMQGSHSDPATLTKALDGIEVVYHLAKADGKRWQDYVDTDVEPTRRLAEAAIRAGVKRFVYTGTIDSYASAKAEDTITNDTPLDPAIATRNLYARSKAECEAVLKRLAADGGLPLVIFRPGVVIGEGSPPAHMGVGRFVSDTHVQYWGDGTNKLPFVLVDDVADALAAALDAPGIVGRDFLLVDEPLLSARDYVAAVQARAGGAVTAEPRSTFSHWRADAIKEGAKHAVRHRNRRASTWHDWDCRAHRARYDASGTREALNWQPAGTADALVERGINASVDRFLR